jgi:hypothetical protein
MGWWIGFLETLWWKRFIGIGTATGRKSGKLRDTCGRILDDWIAE